MISDTLRNLSRRFAAWGDIDGTRLDKAACELLAHQLADCAERAAIMENAPVPPVQRQLRVVAGGRSYGGAA
jgi:predicted Ser/Thr protein kinase